MARDQLLAGARFANNQRRGFGRCDALNLFQQFRRTRIMEHQCLGAYR
jgi:hypothetical protein